MLSKAAKLRLKTKELEFDPLYVLLENPIDMGETDASKLDEFIY